MAGVLLPFPWVVAWFLLPPWHFNLRVTVSTLHPTWTPDPVGRHWAAHAVLSPSTDVPWQ